MMAIEELKKLAESGTDEDWEKIDAEIPKVCNQPDYLSWAYETGIKDDNGDVRDLAVSLLEKSHLSPAKFKPMKAEILRRMKTDPNPFVRYRSAFALVAHKVSSPEIIGVLKEAQKDPNTADIAKEYLSKLG